MMSMAPTSGMCWVMLILFGLASEIKPVFLRHVRAHQRGGGRGVFQGHGETRKCAVVGAAPLEDRFRICLDGSGCGCDAECEYDCGQSIVDSG